MLRATSEMAVAISVSSLPENRRDFASSPAFCPASNTSASAAIFTTSSSPMVVDPRRLQDLEAFLEVEGGGGSLERQSELHHREGHLRLDAHDDGGGAQQFDHLGDAAQRARGKRVHDIKH